MTTFLGDLDGAVKLDLEMEVDPSQGLRMRDWANTGRDYITPAPPHGWHRVVVPVLDERPARWLMRGNDLDMERTMTWHSETWVWTGDVDEVGRPVMVREGR
ncbi:MAG TPA: hypothetical protein VEI97_19075 [bacterium]|nr:hypothetical protein [bacterium]